MSMMWPSFASLGWCVILIFFSFAGGCDDVRACDYEVNLCYIYIYIYIYILIPANLVVLIDHLDTLYAFSLVAFFMNADFIIIYYVMSLVIIPTQLNDRVVSILPPIQCKLCITKCSKG